jgi:hypothetical protein
MFNFYYIIRYIFFKAYNYNKLIKYSIELSHSQESLFHYKIIIKLTKTPNIIQILTYNGFVNENIAHILENRDVHFNA